MADAVAASKTYNGLTANEWIQLAGMGASAAGAYQSNKQQNNNQTQDRFSNVNQRYAEALGQRGQFELDQFNQGQDWQQNANRMSNQQTPFGTYQSAIQRNMLMSALLPGLIQSNANRSTITPNNPAIAALMPQNLGMNFNPDMSTVQKYFNPQAMEARTAGSIAQQERANIGVNPFYQTTNANELGLGQFAQYQPQLQGQAQQANQQYNQGREQALNSARGGLDQGIAALGQERRAYTPKGFSMDENGELKKKPSKWRTVMGNVVKYGGMGAAIAFTGGAALPAVMAASSFAGDKIAGKSTKSALIGAGLSAIPAGGGVGSALGSKVASGISSQMGAKLANAGIQAGVRAIGDNVPYAGMALNVAGASGVGRQAAQSALLGSNAINTGGNFFANSAKGMVPNAARAAVPAAAYTGATNPNVWRNLLGGR